MPQTITQIVVKLQILGLHCWPEVDIPSVDFLAHKHRHTFFITCRKQVAHNDRQIEIICYKAQITSYLTSKYSGDFGRMSCEDIAAELVNAFELDSCEVLEDNENGAVVTKK